MDKIYLDMNVYNRPFDDQTQVRIRLETVAAHAVFKAVAEGKFTAIWSFMLDYENSLNPNEDIRLEIEMASSLARASVHASDDIRTHAKDLSAKGIKPRDALHLASALSAKADYFITCDDKLIKKGAFLSDRIFVMNPVDFVRQEVK